MSLYEYRESQRISAEDYGFYSLIMAAMRKADTDNMYALEQAFPLTAAELRMRYNAPGGMTQAEMDKETRIMLDGRQPPGMGDTQADERY